MRRGREKEIEKVKEKEKRGERDLRHRSNHPTSSCNNTDIWKEGMKEEVGR